MPAILPFSVGGDLEQPRPELSRDKDTILLSVEGDSVQHRIRTKLGERCTEQSFQIDPSEHTPWADCVNGANVLLGAALELVG